MVESNLQGILNLYIYSIIKLTSGCVSECDASAGCAPLIIQAVDAIFRGQSMLTLPENRKRTNILHHISSTSRQIQGSQLYQLNTLTRPQMCRNEAKGRLNENVTPPR